MGVCDLGKYRGIVIMYLYLIVEIISSLRLIHFTAAGLCEFYFPSAAGPICD